MAVEKLEPDGNEEDFVRAQAQKWKAGFTRRRGDAEEKGRRRSR
jgi:hypothetical protein